MANEFLEELACVKLDGKYGFINPDGTWAIPPRPEISRFPTITVNGQWMQRDGVGNII